MRQTKAGILYVFALNEVRPLCTIRLVIDLFGVYQP